MDEHRKLSDFPPPNPQPTPCVLWQGRLDKDGYGVVVSSDRAERGFRRDKRAHRWVWESNYGAIPEGMVVRHKCDNRLCVRRSHLELGTVADNNADAAARNHLGHAPKCGPTKHRQILELNDAGVPKIQIARDVEMPRSSVRFLIDKGWDYYHRLVDGDGYASYVMPKEGDDE